MIHLCFRRLAETPVIWVWVEATCNLGFEEYIGALKHRKERKTSKKKKIELPPKPWNGFGGKSFGMRITAAQEGAGGEATRWDEAKWCKLCMLYEFLS